ncbi:MAG: serine/threonine protein kinase [Clostridia bacterium]|nr:serine/threonine protein kinase [Clostridia bacterium]
MDVLTTCPHCFKNKNNTPSCPNCGYITGNEKHTDVIKPFTVMENRYLMGNVLGRGGFGVTYVAYDKFAEKICAIKEYMPQEYAVRDENTNYIKPTNQKSAEIFNHGKMRFIDEAKILYKLEKTYAVVKFLGLFEANNTAYLVMEYLDGVNLKRLVNSYGGKIPIPLANEVLVTVASTMMEIHKYGILHRDITPENIYITREGAVKLIDFGAARNYLTAQNNGMSVFLKPGFAPPEQYSSKGEQGKYTDVYAVAAVYYNIVSGKKIPDALYRVRGEN